MLTNYDYDRTICIYDHSIHYIDIIITVFILLFAGTESEKAYDSKTPPVPPGQSASALTPPDAKTVTFMTGGETLVVLRYATLLYAVIRHCCLFSLLSRYLAPFICFVTFCSASHHWQYLFLRFATFL
jgi:hypothetical protein